MIEFKNVSKVYENGTKALQKVNLKIDKGEFVFVVGASGAGKSTFLKLIMHEEKPSEGEVVVNGFSSRTMKRREVPFYRRTMGIVFQDFRLIPKMSVYDNVAFAMRVIGAREKEIRKRVPYILGLVGLASKARNYPTELSGGEQQRVALARALVNNPKIIIADEPTGNVDPEMSFEIVELLNNINSYGTTVVMVTHEHDLVKAFDRRTIVIRNGQVVSDGEDSSILETEKETAVSKEREMFYYHEDVTLPMGEDFISDYDMEEEVYEEEPDGEEYAFEEDTFDCEQGDLLRDLDAPPENPAQGSAEGGRRA